MENHDKIKIKSIEIGHYSNFNYYNLLSLKVTLSNGHASPLISAHRNQLFVKQTATI